MGYKVIHLRGVVAALGLVFVLVVFFTYRDRVPSRSEPAGDLTLTTPFFPPSVIGDNKFYINLLLRFSISFPKNLNVKEYGAGNTSTITFEDATGEKGSGFKRIKGDGRCY